MIVSSQHAVGTAALQIASPDDNPQLVIIHDHDHTISNGLHLPKTETIEIMIDAGDSLYAVADGGSVEVHVLQVKR